MLWAVWFFALLGFYGLTTWLGALLQAKGFPVTKSVFYTILISLAGIPGFLVSAWLVEAWGRKATLRAQPACGGRRLLFLRLGGGPDPADHSRPLHAVLPVRDVVGALRPTRRSCIRRGFAPPGPGSPRRSVAIGSLIGPYVIGVILPAAGLGGVFALGAGAFVMRRSRC